jgi:hypothetical protein
MVDGEVGVSVGHGDVHIITGDIEIYKPTTRNLVLEVIDMRVPRQIAQHDKLGYNNFLSAMKAILFGDPSHRMNETRCEEFFENEGNFVLANQCATMQPDGTEAQWAKDSTAEEACSAIIKW